MWAAGTLKIEVEDMEDDQEYRLFSFKQIYTSYMFIYIYIRHIIVSVNVRLFLFFTRNMPPSIRTSYTLHQLSDCLLFQNKTHTNHTSVRGTCSFFRNLTTHSSCSNTHQLEQRWLATGGASSLRSGEPSRGSPKTLDAEDALWSLG